MTNNSKNQEVISSSVIAHLLRDLYSPTSSKRDRGTWAAMTHRGFTKPSRGMSTKCESRTRVCRNRAFDSKCERFRLTKGTNELASCVTLSAELSRGAVASSGTKAAFTLAEVLITLAIVGVVAAITMPALIANIQDKVKAERIKNITQKFGKATDKMKSLSTLGGYATTMDFVNELQKHLKIAKVCDNQHLTECWPTETVMLDDDKEWEISQTKTGKQLKMTNDDTHEYGDTVGIVTADGTAMILTYNAKCDIDEAPVTWSNNQSSTSGCVAAVFDWNGSKMPNKLSKVSDDGVESADVILFNAIGLGSACALEVGGKCFGASFVPTPVTKAECEQLKADGYGIQACNYDNDYWAGAVKQCGGTDKMPTMAQLGQLASLLYEGNPTVGAKDAVSGITYNGQASSLGLPEPTFYLWSGEEYSSSSAYDRYFRSTYTGWHGYTRDYSNGRAVCLGD